MGKKSFPLFLCLAYNGEGGKGSLCPALQWFPCGLFCLMMGKPSRGSLGVCHSLLTFWDVSTFTHKTWQVT